MYLRKSKLQYHAKPEKSNPIIARRLQEILGGAMGRKYRNVGLYASRLEHCWQ